MFALKLTLFICFLLPLFGIEQVENNSRMIVLPTEAVHEGDYFAAGHNVEISGTVLGDLYVVGTQVFVDGVVKGDILLAAGSVEISGRVDGNIRALGGQALITGTVGRNLTLVAGNGALSSGARINGNVVCIAGNGDFAATIGESGTVIASNLRVSSPIGKNLIAYVGDMRVTSRASIGGDIDYSSNNKAWIDPGAKIKGKVFHHISVVHDLIKGKWLHSILLGSKIATLVMNFLYSFVVGIILIRVFPQHLQSILDILNKQPWKAVAYGLMLLVLLPLASLILLMTILGVPFALTLLTLNVIGFYTAKVFSVLWLSNYFGPKIGLKPNHISTLCVGLILYFLVIEIPFLGVCIAFATMLFGLGASVLGAMRKSLLEKHLG